MYFSSLILRLAMALAVAQTASATHPAGEEPSCSTTKDQRSLLSNMLEMTGFSDTCVAAALDACGTGQTQGPYTSLIEEAREVVQQASAAIAKWDSQLSAAVNTIESQLSAAANKSESQLSAIVNMLSVLVNKTESETSAAQDKSESQLSAIVNMLSVLVNKTESETSAGEDTSETRPRHCQDLKDSGDCGIGPRQVYPYLDRPLDCVTVVCDQSTDGGGWTVFQRRSSDAERQDFFRTWREYQDGFGDLQGGEFWLGLTVLHQLTSSTPSQLRVDLHDYEGGRRWAKYGNFTVGRPDTNYRLTIAQYTGDAGDSLAYSNGKPFSTRDADHDNNSQNCAASNKGAWWYGSCANSNLNGYQHVRSHGPDLQGIFWYHWRGSDYSLKQTAMMTRPTRS